MVETFSVKLGDVADIVMGQSPAGDTCNRSGIGDPLLNGPTEFGPHHPVATQFTTDPRKHSRHKDILFCVRGSTTGRMNWSDKEYAIGRGIAAIRHKRSTGFHPLIRSIIEYHLPTLLKMATGSTFPNVSARQLAEIPFISVNESEQLAMASLFGVLDEKIELNRQTNVTLEAMARALFKDWFVDFGPTRAKMEGGTPYLAPDLWSLFPARTDKETGLPEGWKFSTIGEEVRVIGGTTPSTKEPEFWNGEYNWATPKDLSKLTAPVLLGTSRTVTQAGLQKIGSGLLPVGTVLLSSRAPIGYLAIAEAPMAIGHGFIGMVCEGRVSNVFAWLWTLENMGAILANANGSTFQEISKGNYRPLPIALSSAALMTAFDAAVMPIYQRIVLNEKENRVLSQTRDLLLPKLMSGEVHLREAEQIAGEVL